MTAAAPTFPLCDEPPVKICTVSFVRLGLLSSMVIQLGLCVMSVTGTIGPIWECQPATESTGIALLDDHYIVAEVLRTTSKGALSKLSYPPPHWQPPEDHINNQSRRVFCNGR